MCIRDSLWTAVWFFGGKKTADELRAPVFFSLLVLPLPNNKDLVLIAKLQKLATECASQLLDLKGIYHGIEGVALFTPSKQYLVAEACSGIHSLFSCVCAVVLISVTLRSSLYRIGLNICQAVFWVIAANSLRVFLIVYTIETRGIELDVGWRHDLLGVFTYALAFGFSISFDRLIEFAVPRKSGLAVPKTKGRGTVDKFHSFMNRSRLSRRSSGVLTQILAGLFIMLGLWNVSAAGWKWFQADAITGTKQTPVFDQKQPLIVDSELIPNKVRDWNLVDVKVINRNPDSPFGMRSIIHFYEGNGLVVQASIDGYYSEWHDLAYCYSALDWEIQSQKNRTLAESQHFRTDLTLVRNGREYNQILFGCYDSTSAPVKPDDPTLGVIQTWQLKDLLSNKEPASPTATPPIVQFQLLCRTDHKLMPHEQQELDLLYKELSGTMLAATKGGE